MAIRKHRMNILEADGSYSPVYLETSANIVLRDDGVTNVEASLNDIAANVVAAQTCASAAYALGATPNLQNASGVLSITKGGTGLEAAPSALTNLSSTATANLFTASPRPGITGVLGVAHGGLGVSTLASGAVVVGNGTGAVGTKVIDSVVTEGSANLVSSAAVFNAVQSVGPHIAVSDVLTSSSTADALSANMGRYLKSLVDAKGTVSSVGFANGTGIAVNDTAAITGSGVRSFSLVASGVTAGSYGPNAAASFVYGGSFVVPSYTTDTYGRITAAANRTITLSKAIKDDVLNVNYAIGFENGEMYVVDV